MDNVRVIEVKRSIFESNDKDADKLRGELKESKTFLLNLMSSPGSGKPYRHKPGCRLCSSPLPSVLSY